MSTPFPSRKTAQLLVQVAKDIVWPGLLEIASKHQITMAPLKVKVGSGLKTYHCLENPRKPVHHIIFGERMVIDKRDPVRARAWLTCIEIVEKGYFDGATTYLNMLAHVILHECAHALQTAAGDRRRGEVHNDEFYAWLGRLHKKVGEQTVTVLKMLAEQQGIELEYDQSKVGTEKNVLSARDLILGKEYEFKAKSGLVQATLVKVNRRTATFEKGPSTYRVPLMFIRQIDGASYIENKDVAVEPPPRRSTSNCVIGFEGKHFFLSNEFDAPINYRGHIFKTAEHLYLWLTIPSNESWWRHKIINAPTALDARKIWVTESCPRVNAENWDSFRIKAMKRAIWEKFQNPALSVKLERTSDMDLVAENAQGDLFFGEHEGRGDNHLGTMLMQLRGYLKQQREEKAV